MAHSPLKGKVIEALKNQGAMTSTELAKVVGFSYPRVSIATRELCRANVIAYDHLKSGKVGKPHKRYFIAPKNSESSEEG